MCGIFGIAEFQECSGASGGGARFSVSLEKMGMALVHRGPDDKGLALFSGPVSSVGIGMRRLSIIDVDGGHQPITNEDGSIAVVCNGEIYNYLELREELLAKGHSFKTLSDTEVLVHLYEEYGWQSVSRLRGMFAFALWDARNQVLMMARDRLGIKPLFYHYGRGRLAFASEVRGLLPAVEGSLTLDRSALLRLLLLQYIPAPETAFGEIHKLMPGTVALADKHDFKHHRYWNVPVSTGPCEEARIEQQTEKAIRTCLEDAVNAHLVSDVPIGAFLSGGLDSTAVVALMSRMGLGAFHTFSVGFEGPARFTELGYAREVAERFGTIHQELMVTPQDVISYLPRLVGHLDEPLADPAIVPTYLLSRLAAQRVKVVLTGEGADELFGGYQRYELDGLAAWSRWVPVWLRSSVESWLQRAGANRRWMQGVRALSHNEPWRRHLAWVGVFMSEELMNVVEDSRKVATEIQGLEEFFRTFFDGVDQVRTPLAGMLKADLSTWLPDDLLAKVDRMSMAASLEARVPYLDHQLVELVASLPPSVKINNGVRKFALKQAIAPLVPPAILNRPKMGFELPLASWIRGPLREFVADHLKTEGPPGFLKQTTVDQLLEEHLQGHQDWSKQVWSLLVMKLWFQTVVHDHAEVTC